MVKLKNEFKENECNSVNNKNFTTLDFIFTFIFQKIVKNLHHLTMFDWLTPIILLFVQKNRFQKSFRMWAKEDWWNKALLPSCYFIHVIC